jgi:transcription antitermination factor NusG
MSEAGTKTNSDAKWYIVHTYSNFEKKVAEEIKRQAKIQGLDEEVVDVIVPTEEVIEVRRGQKVNAERKFLPGYVLLHAKLTDECYHLVKNVAKVTGFLGQNNKPMPLRQGEVDRILNHLRDWRTGTRGRRPIHIFHRHGRRGRRGAQPREGRGLDLRARNAGRVGIHAGRESLI